MFRQKLVQRVMPYVLGVLCAMTPPAFADETRTAQASGAQPTSVANSGDYSNNNRRINSDYPDAPIHEWVMAYALAARTRALFRQADDALATGIRRADAHFKHSRDYQEALADERKAYAEYNAARDKALNSLANDTRYREIVRLRDELGARLEARRHDRSAGKDEIAAMALLKMQYATDARTIEVQAVDANADVKAARDRMVAAGRKAIEMRAGFDDAQHDNPQVAQLRKDKEDARVAMLSADAYGAAASASANAAIDYSYWIHRIPFSTPYDTSIYGYGNGYTSGYYSPYWGR